MQNLFLPSSMIAGFVALLLGPQVLGKLIGLWAEEGSLLTSGALPDTIITVWDKLPGLMINIVIMVSGRDTIITVWDKLPGLMINIVFATLFLGKQIPSKKDVLDYGGPQLAYGWTVGWGQYVIGILLMVLFITPVFGLPSMAGALIEIAFEGGHGTAAGLQGTFKKLGFEEGYDLAIGLATIGVLTVSL